MKVLIIYNYASFGYNLYQEIGEIGADPPVLHNQGITTKRERQPSPHSIRLAPRPGHPTNPRVFGVCRNILDELSPATPTLGVCLGHQGIGTAYGGKVGHAARILHGKTSLVRHDGRTIFEGLPNPITAGRYHSLAIDRGSLPQELELSATSDDGEIMAVRHRRYPIEGVQFHPESILTPEGPALLRNFLAGARR